MNKTPKIAIRTGWRVSSTGWRGAEVPISWYHPDHGLDGRRHSCVRYDQDWTVEKPYFIGYLGSSTPFVPETRFRTLEEAQDFVECKKPIRVPAKFYIDHDDRACEPFCEPVKRSSRFVWLLPSDPGLPELLDDARHYADPDNFGSEYTDLRRSAAATVKAIEAAQFSQ